MGAAVAALVGAACASAQSVPASAPTAVAAATPAQGALSVLDGVFTVAQAGRGNDVFQERCAKCHAVEDFTRGLHQVTVKWTNVGDLFTTASTRMPQDDPGALQAPEYAAVVSYLLQANGFPANSRELPSDVRRLTPIRIVKAPGAGAH